MQILRKTALYEAHIQLNGKIVDFSGWALPLHYGSQLNEHQTVRKAVSYTHLTLPTKA